MFDYRDYHRTVVAFHGTTVSAANRLVNGGAFEPSNKSYEWLGKGVYFWEYAPKQAWWWTRYHRKTKTPAVVGAMIRLGNCLDLLDPENVRWLKSTHDDMMENWRLTKAPIPQNVRDKRGLDCAVLNWVYTQSDAAPTPIETCRGCSSPRTKRNEFGEGVGFMKKLTSKSVSAAPRTSSRYGTSVQTAVTAKKKKVTKAKSRKASAIFARDSATGTFQLVAEKARKMSPPEFRLSLLKAGIIGTNGKLTAHYAKAKKK